ncbi:hypothetical protein K9M59_01550 [Candidatus Gracilibacteria bacterium]|nr:hypothetical protein [Candidatus Gracilibacteria bacterium]MCF7819780.1 hypothetical protein [Candidatus Gracilibacteria bacterium]
MMKYILFIFSVFGFFGHVFAVNISGYELSSVELTPLGSGTEIKIGRFAQIGRFRATNRSPNNKKIEVQALRLHNYGTADLDEALENAGIYVQNEKISTQSFADRKDITFTLENGVSGGFLLRAGDSVIFEIKATLAYARPGDTIQLGFRYEEDFVATEVGNNFQVEVSKKIRMETYPLGVGDLSVIRNYRNNSFSKNSRPSYRYYGSQYRRSYPTYTRYIPPSYQRATRSIPSSRNRDSYSPGSQDITFLQSYSRNDTPVRVEGVAIEVTSGSRAQDKNSNGIENEREDFERTFSDFRLYINGEMVDSTDTFSTGSGGLELIFDSSFDLFQNSQIQVVGRITHNAQNGDRLQLRLNPQRFFDPEYLHSGDSLPQQNIRQNQIQESTGVEPGFRITK